MREELGEQNTAFVRINVAQELARWREIKRSGTKKEEKQIWKNLSEDAMNKLRGQVLRFYREELLKAGGVKKVATELNVSQAAVYGWCKEDKYADLELSKRNLRQAPKRAGEDA